MSRGDFVLRVGFPGRSRPAAVAWIARVLAAAALNAVIALPARAALAPDFVVVVRKDAALDRISRTELGRLFLTLSGQAGGVKLKAVNLSDKPLKMSFMVSATGMASARIEDHFVQLELRGEGKWPPQVASAEELVSLIAKSGAVIGWLPVSELETLSPRQQSLLKVLAVN